MYISYRSGGDAMDIERRAMRDIEAIGKQFKVAREKAKAERLKAEIIAEIITLRKRMVALKAKGR